MRAAFPDGHFTLDEAIAEGDKVVQRWTFRGTFESAWGAAPPTGKPVTFAGTTTPRIAGGKVAEHSSHWDVQAWLKQVGKVPW